MMLLCDVACGKPNQLTGWVGDAHLKQPKNTHHTFGIGSTHPDPKGDVKLEGSMLPNGKPIKRKKSPGGCWEYQEFIVYNAKQVQMKYLFKVKIGK